jgi:hypothetical protein
MNLESDPLLIYEIGEGVFYKLPGLFETKGFDLRTCYVQKIIIAKSS